MAVKHMPFFKGATGTVAGGGMGSVTDMWGDGVVSYFAESVQTVVGRVLLVLDLGQKIRGLLLMVGEDNKNNLSASCARVDFFHSSVFYCCREIKRLECA